MNRTDVALWVLVCLLVPSQASAYVDPGTGGMLVQLLAGGVAGLAMLARLYWRRARGVFSKLGPSEPDASAPPTNDQAR